MENFRYLVAYVNWISLTVWGLKIFTVRACLLQKPTGNLAPLYAGALARANAHRLRRMVGSLQLLLASLIAKERRQLDKALQRYGDWSEQASQGEYASKLALVGMHEGEGMCTEVRMRPELAA